MTSEPRGIVRVTVRGEVDAATAPQLESVAAYAVRSATEGVVVDISQLDFIDATGFHALERAQRVARRREQSFLVLADAWKMRIAEVVGSDLEIRLATEPGQWSMRAWRPPPALLRRSGVVCAA